MAVTTRRRVATTTALLIATIATLTALAATRHLYDPAVDVPFVMLSLVAGAAFAGAGALLLALRPDNPIGPLLCVAGGAVVVELALREYAWTPGVSGREMTAWLSRGPGPAVLARARLRDPEQQESFLREYRSALHLAADPWRFKLLQESHDSIPRAAHDGADHAARTYR